MPGDSKSGDSKKTGDKDAEKPSYDHTKGYNDSKDHPSQTGNPSTLEEALRFLTKKAFELNRLESQQQRRSGQANDQEDSKNSKSDTTQLKNRDSKEKMIANPLSQLKQKLSDIIKKIHEDAEYDIQNKDVIGAQIQKAIPRLEQIANHLIVNFRDGYEVYNIQKVALDFGIVINMHMEERIKKQLGVIWNKVKGNKPIDKKNIVEVHAGVFGSLGASGSYYLWVRNSIHSDSQELKEFAANATLGKSAAEFQQALDHFSKALDKTFPWEYEDSAGQTFGGVLKPGLPNDVKLSLNNLHDVGNLKDIVTAYNALQKKKEALSKSLDITVQLSQYLASHEGERKQLEEMAREEARKRWQEAQKKLDNSKHHL